MRLNINKTKINLLIVIFANLVVFSGLYFAFRKVQNENEKVVILEKEVSIATVKDGDLLAIKRSIGETGNERKKLDSYLIGSEGAVDFLEYLDSIAKKRNVILSINNIKEEDLVGKGKGLLQNIVIQLTGKGDWTGVHGFLKDMEMIPYKTEVKNVVLDYVDDKDLGDVWRLNMQFYVLKIK